MKQIFISNTQENMTPVLQEILKTLTDDTKLVFEPGEYHFYREGAHVGYFAPSNNYASVKDVVFTVFDKKNVEIDGSGASFVFHGRLSPFIFQNCENLAVKNFSVDFAFPRVYQAEVVSSNDEYLDFYMDEEKYPYSVRDGHLIVHLEDIDKDVDKAYFFNRDANTELSKIWPSVWNMTDFRPEVSETDSGYCLVKYSKPEKNILRLNYVGDTMRYPYVPGHRLILHFESKRDNDTFFLDTCRNVLVENVTIYRGPSMGIIAQLCDDITIDRLHIGAMEERGDLLSTTADSLMFVDCAGKITVKNSYIAQSLDDAFNQHGTYTGVEAVDEHTLLAALMHREQKGFSPYKAGDEIRILDEKTLEIKEYLTITQCEICEDQKHIRLQIKETISEKVQSGNIIENVSRMPEIEMVDNEFYQSTSVMFSSPKKTVIARNKFHTLLEAIRLTDCPIGWMEAGRVKDVLITENFFDHCCEWAGGHIIQIVEHLEREENKDDIHENIRIRNNRFVGKNAELIIMNCSKNVEISGNSFEHEGASLENSIYPFTIHNSSDVRIFDNSLRI